MKLVDVNRFHLSCLDCGFCVTENLVDGEYKYFCGKRGIFLSTEELVIVRVLVDVFDYPTAELVFYCDNFSLLKETTQKMVAIYKGGRDGS